MSRLSTQESILRVLRELVPGVVAGELDTDGRMLRWVEAGTGQPTVILDSALGEPGTLAWASVMPEVAQHARVIAYDRAGIGTSDPAPQVTVDSEVADLIALAAQAGDGGCVLVGHSWGGLLAQLVALRRPDLVAGLVLVDPADENYWLSVPAEVHAQARQAATMLEKLRAKDEHASMVTGVFGDFARLLTDSPQLQAAIMDAYVASYSDRSQVAMVRLEGEVLLSSAALISAIRDAIDLPDVPLVVLSATRTDSSTPMSFRQQWTEMQAELAAAVPGGQHIVLADTSHAINQEQPRAIADAILSVLSQATAP